MVNKVDRKIAAEILGPQVTLMVHATHELFLVAHKQSPGLTEKEQKYLMARHDAMTKEYQKTQKLVERLRGHA